MTTEEMTTTAITQDQRLIDLFNWAWEDYFEDISDEDVGLILKNNGYFTVDLGWAEIPINQENHEFFSQYLSDKENDFTLSCLGKENYIFDVEIDFPNIEEAKVFNGLLKERFGIDAKAQLVIVGNDNGKERFVQIRTIDFNL
jgi:hypothetical protein